MQASTGYGALYIVILAIDTVTALIHSLARIVDRAEPVAGSDTPISPTEVHTVADSLAESHPFGVATRVPAPQTDSEPLVSPHSQADTPRTPQRSRSLRISASERASGASATLVTPAASLRREQDADAAEKGGASTDLRFSLAHASLLAQEQMWADLTPPTEQHGRLLVDLVWQSALEVQYRHRPVDQKKHAVC